MMLVEVSLNIDVIADCKAKLLAMREDLLNRLRTARLEVTAHEKMRGDEIDQSVAQISEDHFLITQERARRQLMEIEFALARIQQGTFGICEETGEVIEPHRLLAIPFTRLSIEGAEIREAMGHKFVGY